MNYPPPRVPTNWRAVGFVGMLIVGGLTAFVVNGVFELNTLWTIPSILLVCITGFSLYHVSMMILFMIKGRSKKEDKQGREPKKAAVPKNTIQRRLERVRK